MPFLGPLRPQLLAKSTSALLKIKIIIIICSPLSSDWYVDAVVTHVKQQEVALAVHTEGPRHPTFGGSIILPSINSVRKVLLPPFKDEESQAHNRLNDTPENTQLTKPKRLAVNSGFSVSTEDFCEALLWMTCEASLTPVTVYLCTPDWS